MASRPCEVAVAAMSSLGLNAKVVVAAVGFLWLLVAHGACGACSIYHSLELNQQVHSMYRSISGEKFNLSPPQWLCATVSLVGREGYYTGV